MEMIFIKIGNGFNLQNWRLLTYSTGIILQIRKKKTKIKKNLSEEDKDMIVNEISLVIQNINEKRKATFD